MITISQYLFKLTDSFYRRISLDKAVGVLDSCEDGVVGFYKSVTDITNSRFTDAYTT